MFNTTLAGAAYVLLSGLELFSTIETQPSRDYHRQSSAMGISLRF